LDTYNKYIHIYLLNCLNVTQNKCGKREWGATLCYLFFFFFLFSYLWQTVISVNDSRRRCRSRRSNRHWSLSFAHLSNTATQNETTQRAMARQTERDRQRKERDERAAVIRFSDQPKSATTKTVLQQNVSQKKRACARAVNRLLMLLAIAVKVAENVLQLNPV